MAAAGSGLQAGVDVEQALEYGFPRIAFGDGFAGFEPDLRQIILVGAEDGLRERLGILLVSQELGAAKDEIIHATPFESNGGGAARLGFEYDKAEGFA